MRTLDDIRISIEHMTEHRAELWRLLSRAHDPALAAELKRVNAEVDRLWQEHRTLRARLRFGERDEIMKRARAEERLERAA